MDWAIAARARKIAAAAARFQAWWASATALCFALFCASSLIPDGVRPAWALMTLIGFRCMYPLMDVTQNALIALGA